jgi:2-oxoisovalerate dehydrogenase E1 component
VVNRQGFGQGSVSGGLVEQVLLAGIARYPERLPQESFYPLAYRVMYFSRICEHRLLELFHKGYVKGTVTSSAGNEATALGMALPLRPGQDVIAVLHRDFPAHLLQGADPYRLVCQYMANAESPTLGREGNVHHGDAAQRRFPMMSHLGSMLSPVVGATWAARQHGEDVFGLTVIGDGGSSTGDFHESLNLASVLKVPVLFLVQNNGYSFSTPTTVQYRCAHLSDRAAGYGIPGRSIDGTDPWLVYNTVCDALDWMAAESLPYLLECATVRSHGHAAYDKGDYVPADVKAAQVKADPLPRTRQRLLEMGLADEAELVALERELDEEIAAVVARALDVPRPDPRRQRWTPYAPVRLPGGVKPLRAAKVKNGDAVRRALEYILANQPRAYLAGLDVGTYGSAFKTCKGLLEHFGPKRVIDLPICESATVGFALGASQVGAEPIVEFQFADFSTEACTQIGLNAGTWYYRAGQEAPVLLRLPCGGGLTLGAFHSGEMEALWSQFPGLKVLYPATAQETYEALLAGFFDRNPCLVLEHKLLYWSHADDIDFDGDLRNVWRPRRYTEGSELTVVAFGAMVHEALAAAARRPGLEVWNPLVVAPLELGPILESLAKTRRLLVVQECGASQGLGDRVISLAVRQMAGTLQCPPQLLAAPDVPVPFAPELETHYRPNAEKILAVVAHMLREA